MTLCMALMHANVQINFDKQSYNPVVLGPSTKLKRYFCPPIPVHSSSPCGALQQYKLTLALFSPGLLQETEQCSTVKNSALL